MRPCAGCRHFAPVVFLDNSSGYDPDDFPNITETYRHNVCTASPVLSPVSGLKRIIRARDRRAASGECGPEGSMWEAP